VFVASCYIEKKFTRKIMRHIVFIGLLLFAVVQTTFAQDTCPVEIPTTPLRLVYVEDGDLWLRDMDAVNAEPVQLLNTGDVTSVNLSDDGQVIVFTRQVDDWQYALWAVNADGSGERLLVSADQFWTLRSEGFDPAAIGVHTMSWIPNTHTLAFTTRPFYSDGLFIAVADDLWTLNVETGELFNLLPRGAGGEFLYSPDGSQIAIMTPDSLSLVNTDGSNRRDDLLPEFAAVGFGEYYHFPQVQWSADGQTLWVVVNASDNPYSSSEGAVSVWAIDIATLTPRHWLTITAFYPSAVLAPDAQHLAYWNTLEEGSNRRDLLVVKENGSQPFGLRGNLLDFVSWSPDARHFVYRGEDQQLWLASICGTARLLVEEDSLYSSVTWIDAGRYFLLNENGALMLNTLDGASTPLNLTSTAYDFTLLG
jgi:dipeptidyl aminopeptidase/acylaminoacyl peptidase